jgi:hypothetical protein
VAAASFPCGRRGRVFGDFFLDFPEEPAAFRDELPVVRVPLSAHRQNPVHLGDDVPHFLRHDWIELVKLFNEP